jgi:hypothetical protein
MIDRLTKKPIEVIDFGDGEPLILVQLDLATGRLNSHWRGIQFTRILFSASAASRRTSGSGWWVSSVSLLSAPSAPIP